MERNQQGRAICYVATLAKPSGINQVVATSRDNAIRALWAQEQTHRVPFEDVAASNTDWMESDFKEAGHKLSVTPMPVYGEVK